MVLQAETQKVNWEKSALYGVNVEEDELKNMPGKMGCSAKMMPFLYLGLPLGGYSRQCTFWQPMIEKMQRKIHRWRRFNLSQEGRATLCQSVFANLPTYYMSLFAIPINIASSLERLMRNFFWEQHTRSKINHLVKWAAPTCGGLGLGALQNKNMALLPSGAGGL